MVVFQINSQQILKKKIAVLLKNKGYDGAYIQLLKHAPGNDDQIFYLGDNIEWINR